MSDAGTLHDAFVNELRDMYDAEKQLTKALPKLAKNASSPDLRSAFESHLEETRGQVERLEQVSTGKRPRTRSSRPLPKEASTRRLPTPRIPRKRKKCRRAADAADRRWRWRNGPRVVKRYDDGRRRGEGEAAEAISTPSAGSTQTFQGKTLRPRRALR